MNRLSLSNRFVQFRDRHDVIFWAFMAAAWFCFLAYVAANVYARSHDPWLTPRYSLSMMVWRRFGSETGGLMAFLFPIGLTLAFIATSRRKRWLAGLTSILFVICPLMLGLPF